MEKFCYEADGHWRWWLMQKKLSSHWFSSERRSDVLVDDQKLPKPTFFQIFCLYIQHPCICMGCVYINNKHTRTWFGFHFNHSSTSSAFVGVGVHLWSLITFSSMKISAEYVKLLTKSSTTLIFICPVDNFFSPFESNHFPQCRTIQTLVFHSFYASELTTERSLFIIASDEDFYFSNALHRLSQTHVLP